MDEDRETVNKITPEPGAHPPRRIQWKWLVRPRRNRWLTASGDLGRSMRGVTRSAFIETGCLKAERDCPAPSDSTESEVAMHMGPMVRATVYAQRKLKPSVEEVGP